jgi:hypothetical protein
MGGYLGREGAPLVYSQKLSHIPDALVLLFAVLQGYIRIERTQTDTPQCATDRKPADGSGCAGGAKTVEVCGACGMLADSSYVTGGFAN